MRDERDDVITWVWICAVSALVLMGLLRMWGAPEGELERWHQFFQYRAEILGSDGR